MTRGELQGPNGMSQLIPGEESTVSEEATIPLEKAVQRGADPSRGPAALPGAGPGSTPYQEGKRNARHLTNACQGSATSPGTQKAFEVVVGLLLRGT